MIFRNFVVKRNGMNGPDLCRKQVMNVLITCSGTRIRWDDVRRFGRYSAHIAAFAWLNMDASYWSQTVHPEAFSKGGCVMMKEAAETRGLLAMVSAFRILDIRPLLFI